MSVNGKFTGFTVQDLLLEAECFAIGTAPTVIDQVREAILQWSSFATHVGVSRAELDRIQTLLLPLPRS